MKKEIHFDKENKKFLVFTPYIPGHNFFFEKGYEKGKTFLKKGLKREKSF